MIYGMEEYESFVRNILQKIPLLKTEQLIKCLINSYNDIDEDVAKNILTAIQRRGYILLSSSGWAMTKRMYKTLSNDVRNIYVKQKNEVTGLYDPYFYLGDTIHVFSKDHSKETEKQIEDLISQKHKDIIDCMWIVADMMPESEDFSFGNAPWTLMFCTNATEKSSGKLFQIVKIPKKTEDSRIEMIKSWPKIKDKETLKNIRRIAIIEDENHAWKVLYLGFTHVIKINENLPKKYEVIGEPRTSKELWKDNVV